MELKNQVIFLPFAKQLKELGVKQESLFYWNICHDCEKEYPEGSVKWELSYERSHGENISAFTLSELGEMLPNGCHINFHKNIKGEYWARKDWHKGTEPVSFYAEKEVNARAKLLIHLLEGGLLTL